MSESIKSLEDIDVRCGVDSGGTFWIAIGGKPSRFECLDRANATRLRDRLNEMLDSTHPADVDEKVGRVT